MKTIIHSSLFLLATLIASVGLVTTINQYPNFALTLGVILGCVLVILGVIEFLKRRRIK